MPISAITYTGAPRPTHRSPRRILGVTSPDSESSSSVIPESIITDSLVLGEVTDQADGKPLRLMGQLPQLQDPVGKVTKCARAARTYTTMVSGPQQQRMRVERRRHQALVRHGGQDLQIVDIVAYEGRLSPGAAEIGAAAREGGGLVV